MRTTNRRLAASLLGFGVVIGLGLLRVGDPYPVSALREIGFDMVQRFNPRPAADIPVRIVDIDEASLAEIGQWPWPRDVIATLTTRLGELGAAAIGFDVLFPEPDRGDPTRDAAFAEALAATPSIVGFSIVPEAGTLPERAKSGFAISGADPSAAVPTMRGAALPVPALMDAAQGLGAVSLLPGDALGVVRRLPMLWSTGETFFPTLSAEALRIALGVSTLVVIAETDGPGAVEGIRIGDIFVPTAPGGELWLHFRPDDPSLYVSARDILSDNYADIAPRIEGQIVLIGASASGLYDRHVTPLGENVPGVSVHAQALEQMLSGTFLTRTDWVGGMELVAFAIAGVAMVLIVISLGPLAGLLGGAGIAAAIAGFAWYMFAAQGVLVDVTFPLLGSAAVYSTMVFLQFAITDADKRQIRRAFAHFVSPSLLTQIERSGDELKLGGEVRELSIMFADVREFTALSERRPPEEIVTLLNVLFGAIGEEVVERSGTIDKFVGDAMMAFWNAPVDVPDHPRLACEAALGMRGRLRTLNETGAFGSEAIRMGTGIATGDALVGNLGLESRFDYSCVGDTVNVASRIESACKELGYDIVLSAPTLRAAPELAALPAGSVILRGKRQRLATYVLVGNQEMALSEGFAQLRVAHEEAVRLLGARADASAAIVACAAIAAEVEPGLVRFYERMAGRVRDFAAPTIAP